MCCHEVVDWSHCQEIRTLCLRLQYFSSAKFAFCFLVQVQRGMSTEATFGQLSMSSFLFVLSYKPQRLRKKFRAWSGSKRRGVLILATTAKRPIKWSKAERQQQRLCLNWLSCHRLNRTPRDSGPSLARDVLQQAAASSTVQRYFATSTPQTVEFFTYCVKPVTFCCSALA